MLSEAGADPFMSEVLGMKRQQIDSVRDVDTDLIEELQLDGRKHLARYVDEFTFRLNDGDVKRHTLERLDSFVQAAVGRHITYKELTA
jgi:hypothetical protein